MTAPPNTWTAPLPEDRYASSSPRADEERVWRHAHQVALFEHVRSDADVRDPEDILNIVVHVREECDADQSYRARGYLRAQNLSIVSVRTARCLLGAVDVLDLVAARIGVSGDQLRSDRTLWLDVAHRLRPFVTVCTDDMIGRCEGLDDRAARRALDAAVWASVRAIYLIVRDVGQEFTPAHPTDPQQLRVDVLLVVDRVCARYSSASGRSNIARVMLTTVLVGVGLLLLV